MGKDNKKLTTQEYKDKLVRLGITSVLPLDEYVNSHTKIRHHCSVCGGVFMSAPTTVSRAQSGSCPYCASKQVLVGFNDMFTTAPELAKNLKNPEDGYTHTFMSQKPVEWKCSKCGAEKTAAPGAMYNGFTCTECSDGISYPEKFVAKALTLNGIKYVPQLSSAKQKWCKNFRYDFYFVSNKQKVIVEVQGGQHLTKNKKFYGKYSDSIRENDDAKEKLAKENGIDVYIRLDCAKSTMDYISKSIATSELAKYVSPETNWGLCNEAATGSDFLEVIELFNRGYRTSEIAKKLQRSSTFVTSSLNDGTRLGLCSYDPEESNAVAHNIGVVCLETRNAYKNLKEACAEHNINPKMLRKTCTGENNVAISRDGKMTHWVFASDYDADKDYSEILSRSRNYRCTTRKVRCLNTGVVFLSEREAREWCNVSELYNVLNGKTNTCGTHPETGERLRWEWVIDS